MSVYNTRLVNKGIIRIGDLLSEKNELITKRLRDLDISPIDAFGLVLLIDALPTKWRQFLKASNNVKTKSTFNLQCQVRLHLRKRYLNK